MGCNAWNHLASCNCGWGGDTGGGHGRHGFAKARGGAPWPDGLNWSWDRRPRIDSYVNPNARCPICGDDVIFYQSPHGGRVFFDHPLGWPWPKHPCTDTRDPPGRRRTILPPRLVRLRIPCIDVDPTKWQPLIPKRVERGSNFDRLSFAVDEPRLAGTFICLPSNVFGHAPALWRRNPNDPSQVDVSIIRLNQEGEVAPYEATIPGWLRNENDIKRHNRGRSQSVSALNRIGWSLSFRWKRQGGLKWKSHPAVDFAAALRFFETAAEMESWLGKLYLGKMYLAGSGVAREPAFAFKLIQEAAQSDKPTALRALASCYRRGIGIEKNSTIADYLDLRAARLEKRAHDALRYGSVAA